MSARGPTSERQEDFEVQWSLLQVPGRGDECSEFFDIPTVKWLLAISLKNVVVSECRCLFDTQLMFLTNEIEPTTKMHDDDERIGSLTEAITDHIPAGQVTDAAPDGTSHDLGVDQEGTTHSRRLVVPSEGDSDEAGRRARLEEWMSGTLDTRQARVKVGATNCSGMISWSAVRKSAGGSLPKHAAVGGWKLRALSFLEKGVKLIPKSRGAQQRDVDGPLECSLAWRLKHGYTFARQRAAGIVPWVGARINEEVQRRQDHYQSRMLLLHPLPTCGPPRHALQDNAFFADIWFFDDGDILCHPALVLAYPTALLTHLAQQVAERDRQTNRS